MNKLTTLSNKNLEQQRVSDLVNTINSLYTNNNSCENSIISDLTTIATSTHFPSKPPSCVTIDDYIPNKPFQDGL